MLKPWAHLQLRFICLLLLSSPACAERAHIAVAANFMPVMQSIKSRFEAQSEHRILLSSGSSGKLFAQIQQGAPYALFFSADTQKPQALEAQDLIVPNSRKPYAVGRLALWAPNAEADQNPRDLLLSGKFTRLALANPRHAPYGLAAVQVLQQLKLTETSKAKWVSGENIAQAYQYVSTGNAPLGFIALAQLHAQQSPVDHRVWLIPEHLHDPVIQERVLLKTAANNNAALALLAFIDSEEIQTLIRSYGYDLPDSNSHTGEK